jgi:hypothetical protein
MKPGALAVAVILGTVLSVVAPLRAQTGESPAEVSVRRLDSAAQVYADSSGLVISAPVEQPVVVPSVSANEKQWPDPTVTLLKSMVVPGWGQITNKRYIKAAIAIGLETWFLSGAIVNNSYAQRALDDFRSDPNDLNHYYDYQYYIGLRSDFLWLLGITVFVSMFDAYVDAHLQPYEDDTIPGVDPPKGLKVVFSF